MALTRAQLLSGNSSNGVVLPGQPQGVIAGAGISISTTGIISVDSSTVTGLVKLNNPFGYNAYVWPGADGTSGEFLQTDGTGNLSWATPQGFAVVTVQPSPAPVPADIGELWFDCSTGTLNVYQNCVGTPSPNWFNVAQPGLPVLPANTTSDVAWTGSGTQASPYLMTATSTGVGTAVQIINTVTIVGLAPFQFVPIVDLNAVANGGRFSFTNNYADASGTLVFNTVFDDQPPSAPGASYNAAIKVGYGTVYIDATVAIFAPLSVTSGSINGTPAVGQILTYTQGVASGGVPAASPPLYNLTQEWFVDGVSTGQTGLNYTVASGDAGKSITVTITAQDSATPPNVATATTTPVVIPIPALSVTSGSISGTAAVGQVLTYTQGVASGGLPPVVLTQEWFVNGVGTGITGLSYTVAAGDAGKAITVTITATDSTSATATATTSPFNIPGPLSIASAGTITGNTTSGSILTYTVGSASGGTAPYTYSYQWKRASDNAVLATDVPTYQLTAAEIGTAVYVTLTATDFVAATASGNTANYPAAPNVITAGAFPNSSFTPAGAPNASPATVSTASLHGTATCNNWQDGAVSLTSTGGIQFQVNGGGFVTSYPGPTANSDTIDVIWDPAAITGAADGATLTGTLTDGIFVNTYTITVSRAVTGLSFPDTTGNALSTPTTSSIITPGGFNVPVTLTFAGTGTDPLNPVDVAVGTGGFLGSPQTVNPGQTLQIQGTTGPTVSTDYGVDLTMGSGPAATDTWLARTTTGAPEITPPGIVTPSAGSTGVGTPAGITITADPYNNLGGAGSPQTSSDWEVYKNAYPLTSTATISAVTPATAGTPGNVQYKTGDSGDTPSATAQNVVYGKLATDAFNDASHPMFQWAKGLSIGGFTDWYIPAKNELEILYYNLKPKTTSNNTSSGINPNAVPARASNYTAGTPAQTSVVIFRDGNAEAFSAANNWSSSEVSGATTKAWDQGFNSGVQNNNNNKSTTQKARAIRRIPIAEYTAAGSPAIGTYLKGGYYGGLISTAGNGTADYALIVAPAIQGYYGYSGGSNATLTIAGANTNGFQVGMQIKGSTSGAVGIILSINATTIQYQPVSGTFQTGETIITDPAGYNQITGSPFTKTTGTLTSLDIAKPPLEGNTKYWVRAQYATTNATATTSAYGAWSDFTTGSLVYAQGTWVLRTNSTAANLFAAAFGNGLYVAAGNSGTLTTSPDGSAWTTRVSSFGTNAINGLTYGGGQFVAVGASGKIATSPDGITWTAQTSGTGNNLTSVTYSGTQYVAVGASGTLLTSPDGVTWTSQTSSFGTTLINSVFFANGVYMAGGASGKLATSTNGLAWTQRTNPTGGTQNIWGFAYGDGYYVYCDDSSLLKYSTNGTTWTTSSTDTGFNPIYAVTFAGGRFWAVGNNGKCSTSTNGTTWINNTSSGSAVTVTQRAVTFGSPAGFLSVGQSGSTQTNAG